MIKFDSTRFGSVTIDGKKFSDVIVTKGNFIIRKKYVLEKTFGTSHTISPSELTQLVSGHPDIVVIGTGQKGNLEVTREIRAAIEKQAELIVLQTPEAIKKYNELVEDHKVNALIHTTC
ncbi:hypothetical protein JW877_04505 [bacterium]|nr:hypothetical protein [bacterium]